MCSSAGRRHFFVAFYTVSFCLGLIVSHAFGASGPLAPTNLRCEYLRNPTGIDVRQPRFAWVLEHTERAEKQSAYQLLIATQLPALDQSRGDWWDSGKVASDDSTQVAYIGKPLASGKTYYWKVRYWDSAGNASPYSTVAQFEMGLLSRDEWKGQWIGGANLLRKDLTLHGKIVRARAYVTALGYYELRINGEKVGTNVLDPAWTTYPTRVLYSSYDVTPLLRSGKNALGAMLGGGWATLGGRFGADVQPYYKAPALLLQVNIELEGGKTVSVASDSSWKVRQGPIVSDSVYDGEVYDARRETPGWDQPGFDDSTWSAAQAVEGSKGTLSAQMMPPIRVVDSMVPVSLSNPKPRVYVYDMGQNMSGWVQLRVQGPAGTQVMLRFAELVYPDGMINRESIRAAKAREIYTLKGEGQETYEPRFTYHGFRYVEVTGYPGTPSLDSLRGQVAHTAVGTVGSFVAAKQILNDIQRLIHWSQLTNLFSIPTDCDQRDERQGWMGDAQATAEEAMMNFDMAAFYTNFVRDIRDAQAPDGSLPSTVPHKYGLFPGDLGWETAYPLLCWYMWQQYGDRRILDENYDGLKKYTEFLRSRATDNVFRFHREGDWVEVVHTPGDYIADVWYYYDVSLLSRIAQVLKKSSEAESYGQLAAQIKDALNRTFFDTHSGNYANGTQTANAMALLLDLVPKEHRGAVANNLTNDIVYYHNTHMTTGFIGVKFLMPALTAIGRSDLAYELATQTTYPSWGYMLEHGATTLWELWQEKTGPSMNSHDHAMFGSVGAWFYQALAGINLELEGAGYQRIRIEPQVVRDLSSVSGTVETIRGAVSSSWTHFPGVITLDVEIPVNSSAKIVVPKELEMTEVTVREGNNVVWEKAHFVPGTPGITAAEAEKNGDIVFEVGSGRYSFRLTGE
jgi:alpha-L-rhamnosidase